MQRACEMVSQRMVGEISSMWIPNDILPEMDENGEFGVKIERKDSMDFYGLDQRSCTRFFSMVFFTWLDHVMKSVLKFSCWNLKKKR